jgi:hypothetical protein
VTVILFLTSVIVSAIDPILMMGYVAAGSFSKTKLGAAGAGALVGAFFAGFSIFLAHANYHEPNSYSVFVQFTACILGALATRSIIDIVHARKMRQPPEIIEAPEIIERRRFAQSLAKMLLERGIQTSVRADGELAERLSIDLARAHEGTAAYLTRDAQFRESIRDRGFLSLVLSDGEGHTWNIPNTST